MTTQTDSATTAIAGALTALLRIDVMILVCWSMTLVYIVVQDRADRQYADQRHQEIMESIRAVPGAMTQQVRVEQRNGVHEGLMERVLKGEFDGNVRRTDGTNHSPAGVDNGQ